MAKKTKPSTALQFVFSASTLKGILSNNPDKVEFTVTVEEAVTKSGEKVGALRIAAVGYVKGKPIKTRDGGSGCPRPPCTPDGN
ncbi:MAG TPA: hypothetical protein VGQ59_12570 [Cyclobacteriaceae bacterium]|jgi:hypothetical protein|nr:hypothetical protein [Cyclobacteriaceae bacterium]